MTVRYTKSRRSPDKAAGTTAAAAAAALADGRHVGLRLVGAPLLLIAAVGTLFGIIDQVSPVGFLSALLIAAWEIGLGFWLVIKGFNPDAVERLEMRELVEVG